MAVTEQEVREWPDSILSRELDYAAENHNQNDLEVIEAEMQRRSCTR
jgi:hypothetical protein